MTLEDILRFGGDKVVNLSKANLQAKGKVATGSLMNSISYKISGDEGEEEISFEMLKYGDFIDRGVSGLNVRRGRDVYTYRKNPRINSNGGFIKSLKEWCKLKGLDEGLAYPIRKNIIENGIKATYFHTRAVNIVFKDMEKLAEQYADELLDDI